MGGMTPQHSHTFLCGSWAASGAYAAGTEPGGTRLASACHGQACFLAGWHELDCGTEITTPEAKPWISR